MTFYNATHYYNILLFFSQNLDHTRCQLPIVLPEKWFSNIQICFSSATNKIILIQSQAIYRILYAVQQLAMNDISINNKHLFLHLLSKMMLQRHIWQQQQLLFTMCNGHSASHLIVFCATALMVELIKCRVVQFSSVQLLSLSMQFNFW